MDWSCSKIWGNPECVNRGEKGKLFKWECETFCGEAVSSLPEIIPWARAPVLPELGDVVSVALTPEEEGKLSQKVRELVIADAAATIARVLTEEQARVEAEQATVAGLEAEQATVAGLEEADDLISRALWRHEELQRARQAETSLDEWEGREGELEDQATQWLRETSLESDADDDDFWNRLGYRERGGVTGAAPPQRPSQAGGIKKRKSFKKTKRKTKKRKTKKRKTKKRKTKRTKINRKTKRNKRLRGGSKRVDAPLENTIDASQAAAAAATRAAEVAREVARQAEVARQEAAEALASLS